MWDIGYLVQVARDRDREEVAGFLRRFDLRYDFDSDETVVVRRDGRLVATGSLRGSVLQCFAVEAESQGAGLSGKIAAELIRMASEQGHTRLFVFTTPNNTELFRGLGFRLLAETSLAALLETGLPTVDDYVAELAGHALPGGQAACGLVMNCNPFTLGHQYLVEQAAASCRHVFVLVVEEDRSAFPYAVRLGLVKDGTRHLSNVTVLPSGPYAVSLATFPSYFSAEETAHARAGAGVDATVYAKYVAKTLSIERRFVGTEPYSPVTAIYNATMKEILGYFGIELVEIPRLEIGGMAVSASTVRSALRNDDFDLVRRLVPQSTLDFLMSDAALQIISGLKRKIGRH